VIEIAAFQIFNYGGSHHKVFHANKNEGLSRHQHENNHAVACYSGSCIIRKEGKEAIINKKSIPIDLPANEWHEIEALEDETVFVNIFAQNKY